MRHTVTVRGSDAVTFCYAEGEEAAIEERRAGSRAAARISETGEVQASAQFGVGEERVLRRVRWRGGSSWRWKGSTEG